MREIVVGGRKEEWWPTEYQCINVDCPGGAVWLLYDDVAAGAFVRSLYVCDACGTGFREVLDQEQNEKNRPRAEALKFLTDDGETRE